MQSVLRKMRWTIEVPGSRILSGLRVPCEAVTRGAAVLYEALARGAAGLYEAATRGASVRMASVSTFQRKAVSREDINRRAERMMKNYGNAILRLAYSYVHSMAEAEDVLQDTLIRVLDANPEFENEAHEKAYLLTAAANVAKNRIEYNRRRETDELNEELVSEEREDLAFVWDAVKKLPEQQREVVHLFYQEGYKTAEIAKILGRKESTVRSDLKRAREQLKNVLKEDYDFG